MKNLKVYPNYIAKVIPLAFDESMSYYECICNITNYINHNIMPIINEETKTIFEITNDIKDLKGYIDNNMLTKDVNDLTYYTLTSDLSNVALTGNYNDLSNKPTIPDVSNFITKDVNDLTYYTLSSNLSTVATSGNYNDLSNKPTIPDVSNFITKDVNDLTYYTLTSNLSTVATSGNYNDLSNKPTIPDVSNFITKDVNNLTYYTLSSNLSTVATSGNYNDLSNKPTIPPTMTILSYGSSTWTDFINAYTTNTIVYCRASSNTNPGTGSQTRLGFMAYVNDATNPTNVEFQYYRSVSTHSATQQGDQVFIYKLDKTNGWSVTTREASSKIVAGTGLSTSYSSGTLTLNNDFAMTSGTWTPKMENCTVTYTRQIGTYKKIGEIVFINCRLRGTITAVGSTPYSQISGLPYTPNEAYSLSVSTHLNIGNNSNNVTAFAGSNGYISIQLDNNNAGSAVASWVADSNKTFYLEFTGFYFID